MKIFKYQHWHFLILLVLLIGIYFYVRSYPLFLKGQFLGVNTSTWFLLAILSPILHQIYVLVCWRMELYYNSISKLFGVKGFKIYKIGFAILILSRILTIIVLAASSADTLNINVVFAYTMAGIIFIPSVYLFYSVKKHFGFDRAFGIDHFNPEEFENKPFVRKGIFKYTANGMYIYGFLILWIPGLLFLSKAALILALFNHIYIWVHYYFTELPDIKIIYKN
ncbi:MAG: hypothetical protein KJN85_00180 [Maribacter sp.]|nr:hypothetical protein [Maribacter sp.]MBT8313739.1 hypothetical protein [Maribacter sp.]